MLGTVLIVVLIMMLLGARWSHSRQWGYFPSGGLGLVVLVVVILVLIGRL